MVLEEDPDVPEPTINTNASLHIPMMITQESLQVVTFNLMTHRPSASTSIKMEQTLKDNLNLEHYCAPVIHLTTGEIITK